MDDRSKGASSISSIDSFEDHHHSEVFDEAGRLAALVERVVRQETGGRIRNLVVDINHKEVVLNGRCNTFYIKQKAQQAAMGILSEGFLTNLIEVV